LSKSIDSRIHKCLFVTRYIPIYFTEQLEGKDSTDYATATGNHMESTTNINKKQNAPSCKYQGRTQYPPTSILKSINVC
ncbi:hypothetical protein L9F63_024609, partial [Diploptera punctata]